ncbi:MAG: zinc ribbon domain-containing protein [Oscillospiraceae bacterium]|nr:zinc ribbon domain-containing protein [Oscillospiraceae bacterium]
MSGFFDKVTSEINKGIATVGANSKAVMEKAKVKSAISNFETERNQLFHLLGQKVHELHKSGNEISSDDGVLSFVAEIDKRTELIAQQNEQLKRIEEELSMVTKGTTGSSQDNSVCKCGSANAEGSRFCTHCGSPL